MGTRRREKAQRIGHAVRRSRTIGGALLAIVGTIAHGFNEALGVALQAANEFAMLAPLVGLGTALGFELQRVTFWLAIGGGLAAIATRLHDASTGANTK